MNFRQIEMELSKYFSWVFTEDFFIVALDCTGCYLFTDNPDDVEIKQQLDELCEDLDLTEEQVIVCVLNRKSEFKYCETSLLPRFILSLKHHRHPIIKDDLLKDILDTYGVKHTIGQIGVERTGYISKGADRLKTEGTDKPRQLWNKELTISFLLLIGSIISVVCSIKFPILGVLVIFLAILSITIAAKVERITGSVYARLIINTGIFVIAIVALITLKHSKEMRIILKKVKGGISNVKKVFVY